MTAYVAARTPAGKRALGTLLKEHDRGFFDDLVMLSKAIGGTAEVYYRSEDPERMAAVVDGMAVAKKEYLASKKI